MSAKSLLGKPVEPYIHDEGGENETSIELKMPLFSVALPILRLHYKYTMDAMRSLRGLLQDGEVVTSDNDLTPHEVAVPLVKACLVEGLTDDEVYEFLVNIGVKMELDFQHPLFGRCFDLCGLHQPQKKADYTEEELKDLLRKENPELADPT